MKELIIAPLLVIVIMGIWNLTLEEAVKRVLQKYLDKKARKSPVFIDPQ